MPLSPFQKPENPPSDEPKIPEYIHAWQEALPVQPMETVNPYNNKHYRKIAKQMMERGYTPDDVTRYVSHEVQGFMLISR
jgi:hypothetical protein